MPFGAPLERGKLPAFAARRVDVLGSSNNSWVLPVAAAGWADFVVAVVVLRLRLLCVPVTEVRGNALANSFAFCFGGL